MNEKERFIAACKRESVDRPPVWVMRQAGRYLPEYLEVRKKHSFIEVCQTPELATEVVMQPLRRFPLDAAILFSDILVVPEALGLTVDYPEGGPTITPTIDTLEDLKKLDCNEPVKKLSYVGDALESIKTSIGPSKALIGFCGAPYTLATYMIQGGSSKRFRKTKKMAYTNPELFDGLLNTITDTLIAYMKMQVEKGADVLQIFDTWAGELSPIDFEQFALKYTQKLIASIKELNVPIIYFVNGVGGKLDQLITSGADVLGVDFRTDIGEVYKRTNGKFALQGNIDPLLMYAPEAKIRDEVRRIHDRLEGFDGHIFNLGHGVLPDTPISGVSAFIDEVCKL